MLDDLSYDTWTAVLEQAEVTLGASEAHGVLTGLACAGILDDASAIAALGAHENDAELIDALELARRHLADTLAEAELGLEPLLPNEELPAVQRSRALTEWCHGFVTGFYFHDRDKEAGDYPDVVGEALADIGDLAEASGTIGDSDLVEVVEYLRVAVQLIYEEVAN